MQNSDNMKRITLLGTILLLTITHSIYGQLADNYGLRIGGGYSNIHWHYKSGQLSGLNGWKKDKTGFSIYLNDEKDLVRFLSVRPEIGYIQKGFREDMAVYLQSPEPSFYLKRTVIMKDLSADIEFKIISFSRRLRPYLIIGLRGDYRIKYKDYAVDPAGHKYYFNETLINDFKKFILSGLLGAGLEYKELVYFEFEYNPGFTKEIDMSTSSVRDRYYGLSVGMNINSLLRKHS